MKGMGEALAAMRKAATDDEPLTIYYAFKQSEAAEDGVTSAGWASFLQAVVDAGLVVDGTWPCARKATNALIGKGRTRSPPPSSWSAASARPTPRIITRADFVRALKRELPDAIDDIRKAGVGPVDMQQSVIGPGMGVFTRYAKVLEDDDSAMPSRRRCRSSTGSGRRSRTSSTPPSTPRPRSRWPGSPPTASTRSPPAN